jgi:hypothetical protein
MPLDVDVHASSEWGTKKKSNLPQNSRPRLSRDSRCKKFSAGRIYEQSQMKDNVLQKSGFAAAFASLLPLWHVLPLVVQSDVSIFNYTSDGLFDLESLKPCT